MTTDTQSTQNIPTTSPTIEEPMSTDNHIKALFDEFIAAGGEPKVTAFKKHIDALIKTDIKHLCSGSGKTANGSGSDWRREQKAMFAGRGAKWVQVALDVVNPKLDEFEEDGIDCSAYRAWTTQAGYAWIRFSAPRLAFDNIRAAAFEVRTEGSTKDHPKQLHYIALTDLDDQIEQMTGTPKSLKLEEDGTPTPSKSKAPKKKKESKTESTLSDLANSINEELSQEEPELSELPESADPEEWSAFLEAEGLADLDDSDVDFDENF